MERGAWRATVHGVKKSWTRLSNEHFHTFRLISQQTGKHHAVRNVSACALLVGPKWHSRCVTEHGSFSKLKQHQDLAISLLKVKAGTRTDTSPLMFIAALFTIVRRQKQPKCPPFGWIRYNTVYTYIKINIQPQKEENSHTCDNTEKP